MIRVLHVVASMDRGGLETFIMNIYRNINRSLVQFDFLVHTEDECAYDREIISLGGKIYRVPSRRKGILKNRNELKKFFDKHNNYKIIHQHLSSLTYVQPLKIAKKYKIPTRITHSHNSNQSGNPIHQFLHSYNKIQIQSFATDFYSCSEVAASWLYPKKIYENGTYEVIKNAIDTREFKFNELTRKKIRRELNVCDKFVLGHVGRFAHQKNHALLVDIFKNVYSENQDSVLLLVGDGELRKDIEEKVERYNLKDSVIFTGVQSNISELLQAMDVFVMPSHYEGLPVTIIEAQTSGLPCVLSANITKEVEIVNNIQWCDISEKPSTWAKKILNVNTEIREDRSDHVIRAGYDILNISQKIQEWYMNKYISI